MPASRAFFCLNWMSFFLCFFYFGMVKSHEMHGWKIAISQFFIITKVLKWDMPAIHSMQGIQTIP